MEKLYKQAQEDEFFRQEFLNQFLKKYPGEGVSHLIYHTQESFEKFLNSLRKKGVSEENIKHLLDSSKMHKGTDISLFAFLPRSNLGTGKKSQIFVTTDCFNLNYKDFISVLVDHEYIHANHVKQGIILKRGLEISYLNFQYFNPSIVLLIDECIAYQNTLIKAIKNRNLSSQIKSAIRTFKEYNDKLKKFHEFKSSAEEAAVKFVLEKNDEILRDL